MRATYCNHYETVHFGESPEKMVGCICGRNRGCPICGFGWGCVPHSEQECHKMAWDDAMEKSLKANRDIWQALAEL